MIDPRFYEVAGPLTASEIAALVGVAPMANERQAPQSDIKQLISKGLEQGYLTYAEVNDHLPDDLVDPEQIEDIIGMINGMGIEVHEVAPDVDTLLLADGATGGREVDDTAAEEAAAEGEDGEHADHAGQALERCDHGLGRDCTCGLRRGGRGMLPSCKKPRDKTPFKRARWKSSKQ